MPINAVPIISESGDTYIDLSVIVDGAGNILFSVIDAGNDNAAYIYKLSTSGQLSLLETVEPGPGGVVGHKIDKADINHTGPNLVVGLITHDATSVKPRSIRVELAQVPNVYVVRAGEDLEEGGAGAFQPTGEPEPPPIPGGGMTIEELTEALADQNSDLSVALGKIVKNKSRDAMGIEKVLTENNTKDYLYQWQLDRMYEVFNSNVPGFWEWMVERVGRP